MFRTASIQALGKIMLFGRKPFIIKREENRPCPNLLPCQKDYCCSVAKSWLFATLWTAAHQASLSFTVSQSLLKFVSTELVMPSNHLILWCPLLPLPSIFPSIRVFSNESALHIRWPKCWRIIGGWLFLRGCRYWSISENSRSWLFEREIYISREKEKSPFVKISPSP